MKTFEEYLKESHNNGIIDYKIRSYDGKSFYIHPDSKNGDTLDFEVYGNTLKPIVNGEVVGNKNQSITVNVYANIQGVDEINKIITKLEERLKNLKVTLNVGD